MSDRAEHEAAIANAFISPGKRSRFLETVAARKIKPNAKLTPRELKRRSKYHSILANFEHWVDPKCQQVEIAGSGQRSQAASKLAELGASASAYVMSEDQEIDGRVMELEEVFDHLAGNYTHGTLVVWGKKGVAYYEQSELAALTRLFVAARNQR